MIVFKIFRNVYGELWSVVINPEDGAFFTKYPVGEWIHAPKAIPDAGYFACDVNRGKLRNCLVKITVDMECEVWECETTDCFKPGLVSSSFREALIKAFWEGHRLTGDTPIPGTVVCRNLKPKRK